RPRQFSLLRHTLVGGRLPSRRGADEAAEISKIDLGRGEVRGDNRPLPGVLLDRAMEVARTDDAAEAVKAEFVVGVIELPGDSVRRRLWDRDAGQVIEVAHVGAGQLQLEVGAAEGQRISQRARQAYMRRTIGELEVNRIGMPGIFQRKHRATDKLAGDGLAGIGALGVDHDLRLRHRRAWGRRRRLPRRDPQREISLQSGNYDMRLTIGDTQIAYFRAGAAGCVPER